MYEIPTLNAYLKYLPKTPTYNAYLQYLHSVPVPSVPA